MKNFMILKKRQSFIGVLLAFALLICIGMNVAAANAKITGLKQTGAYANKATIAWIAPTGAGSSYNRFFVQYSKDGKAWVDLTNTASNVNTLTMTGLSRGTTYFVRVKAVFYNETTKKITLDGAWADAIEVATMPGSVGNIVQTKATKSSMTFTWGESAGANCYDVYFGSSYSKLKFQARITGRTVTIKGRKQGSVGYVKVVPVRLTKQSYTAAGLDTYGTLKTTQKAVKLSTENEWDKNSKTIHFTWTNPNKMTDGFEIRVYDNKNKVKGKSTTKKNYYFFRKANKKNSYKIKVRPYINVNSKKLYGPWKTAYALQPAQITGVAQDDGSVTISWTPVSGSVSGYAIYAGYYPDENNMAHIATVGKKVTKLSTAKIGGSTVMSNKRLYFCVKSTKVSGGVTYYSTPSNIASSN